MARYGVLLLLLALLTTCTTIHTQDLNDFEFEGRLLAGGATILSSKYPWIVAVYDTTQSKVVGPGALINQNYVACSSIMVASNSATPRNLIIYPSVDDAATVSGPKRRGTTVKLNTLPGTSILHAIALVKFCIPITVATYAPLPTAGQAYAFGSAATYVNYGTVLQEVTRKMGEDCQCKLITNYDFTYHFCLDEEDVNFIKSTDLKGSIAIAGGKFAGINVGIQNNGGEPYVDVGQYITWINTNAV